VNNVFLNFDCGGCCESKQWHLWVSFLKLVEVQVVLPEVLSPMANAMNLVNYEAIDVIVAVKLINGRHKCRTLHKFLWSQVDNFVL